MSQKVQVRTKEEKKQDIRDYLQESFDPEKLGLCSLYDIGEHTKIELTELLQLLDELEDEGTTIYENIEFEIDLLNTDENKKIIKNLKRQKKIQRTFNDSQKVITALSLTAFLFF